MSIKLKLVCSFLLIVLLSLGVGSMNINHQQQTAAKFKQITEETTAEIITLNQMNLYVFSVIKDTLEILIIEAAMQKAQGEKNKQQQKIRLVYDTNKNFIEWSQKLKKLINDKAHQEMYLEIAKQGEQIFTICLQIISDRGDSTKISQLKKELHDIESNFQKLVHEITKINLDNFTHGDTEAKTLLDKSITYGILGIILTTIIAVVLALFLYKGIITPINLLKKGTQQIAKENFSHSIAVDSGDEFAELAQAFNHMARMLENHRKRIHDHTQIIRVKNQDLAEALQHKSEFLANMSHELRTPLNAMIGYTTITLKALKSKIGERHLQNLQFSQQAAKTLLHLINDILDFSRIETGKIRITPKTVNLREVIEDCAITTRGMLANKPVKLEMELFSNIPKIKSDRTKLEQILRNLLNNSAKFTKEGKIQIRATYMRNKDSVYLEIEDTGCGIPQKNIDNVFEVFTQVDSSTKKSFSGSGLGLAIAKKLCNMLGIEIGVHSEIDKGSIFWLVIPIQFFHTEKVEDPTSSSQMPIFKEVFERETPNVTLQTNDAPSAAPKVNPKNADEQKETSQSSLLHANATNIETNDKATHSQENDKNLKKDKKHLEDKQTNITIEKKQELAIEQKDVMMQDVWVGCIVQKDTFQTLKELLDDLPMVLKHLDNVESLTQKNEIQMLWAIIVESDCIGIEHLMHVKDHKKIQEIPVIMCSKDQSSVKSWGKIDHIAKPINEEQLVNVLANINKKNSNEILVVDDDENCHTVYKDTIESLGYQCCITTSSVDALEYLQNNKTPLACIINLLLPAGNGFKLLDSLRNTDSWRNIPIVVTVDKDLSSEQQQQLEKGSYLLLEKGNFEDLKKNVSMVINDIETARTNTILIVDDNNMNLDLASGVCQDAGYTVYEASSAQEGINICEEYLPDCVIMDLAMPGMDGFEATRTIKKNPKTTNIPIIACSAFAMDEFRKRAFQAGCCNFIVKPISPETFITQVKKSIITNQIQRMHNETDFVGR